METFSWWSLCKGIITVFQVINQKPFCEGWLQEIIKNRMNKIQARVEKKTLGTAVLASQGPKGLSNNQRLLSLNYILNLLLSIYLKM